MLMLMYRHSISSGHLVAKKVTSFRIECDTVADVNNANNAQFDTARE